MEYLVKWQGYSKEEATWEPPINLRQSDGAFKLMCNYISKKRNAKLKVKMRFLSGGASTKASLESNDHENMIDSVSEVDSKKDSLHD